MRNQDEAWLLKEKYNGQKTEGFLADCARLEAGEPLAYVIGYIPFLNCTIYLDSHPLIPRPETEFWVEHAIATISHRTHLWVPIGESYGKCLKILDLCAGSGCIGVAVAKATGAQVDFAEIDSTHHATILKNLSLNQNANTNLGIINDTKTVYDGDLFAEIPSGRQYDFILTNPPYIDPALDRAEESVKTHEPHIALYGGDAGMELIERIISAATPYLSPNGQLWLEHEPEQTKAITTLATHYGFVATTHKDQYDIERYSVLVLQ